jgi:hypothetical protein
MPALLLALGEQRQEIALDVFDIALHPALQLGACRGAGRDEKAVVFGKATLPIPVGPQVAEIHLHAFPRGGRAQDHRGGKLRDTTILRSGRSLPYD